jgi:hypothetical protein
MKSIKRIKMTKMVKNSKTHLASRIDHLEGMVLRNDGY